MLLPFVTCASTCLTSSGFSSPNFFCNHPERLKKCSSTRPHLGVCLMCSAFCFCFFIGFKSEARGSRRKQQLSPLLVRLLSNEKGPLSSPCTALQLSVRIVSSPDSCCQGLSQREDVASFSCASAICMLPVLCHILRTVAPLRDQSKVARFHMQRSHMFLVLPFVLTVFKRQGRRGSTCKASCTSARPKMVTPAAPLSDESLLILYRKENK